MQLVRFTRTIDQENFNPKENKHNKTYEWMGFIEQESLVGLAKSATKGKFRKVRILGADWE